MGFELSRDPFRPENLTEPVSEPKEDLGPLDTEEIKLYKSLKGRDKELKRTKNIGILGMAIDSLNVFLRPQEEIEIILDEPVKNYKPLTGVINTPQELRQAFKKAEDESEPLTVSDKFNSIKKDIEQGIMNLKDGLEKTIMEVNEKNLKNLQLDNVLKVLSKLKIPQDINSKEAATLIKEIFSEKMLKDILFLLEDRYNTDFNDQNLYDKFNIRIFGNEQHI
ncbi:MAG: hypothetical protein NTZ49_00460 [Candidatus Parcubacteria bacterium]|nr:hypothetical protein [Candidatus Parcubacteria bacterium]